MFILNNTGYFRRFLRGNLVGENLFWYVFSRLSFCWALWYNHVGWTLKKFRCTLKYKLIKFIIHYVMLEARDGTHIILLRSKGLLHALERTKYISLKNQFSGDSLYFYCQMRFSKSINNYHFSRSYLLSNGHIVLAWRSNELDFYLFIKINFQQDKIRMTLWASAIPYLPYLRSFCNQ